MRTTLMVECNRNPLLQLCWGQEMEFIAICNPINPKGPGVEIIMDISLNYYNHYLSCTLQDYI